jgi:sterol desaturase/sphingolipid hydroxylase (fatty acid hydroxylase superfamily)
MGILARLLQHIDSLGIDLLRLGAWLAVLLIIFVPLERLWPLRAQRVWRKAFGSDVVYFFMGGVAPRLLLILPLSLLAAGIHRVADFGLYPWVASLPTWVRFPAALVVGEIGFYWGHRWSHIVPLLWRFHAIHHSAEEIDWLVSARAHPVDLVFTRLCGLIPMYLLGLAQPLANTVDLVPVLVTVAGTVWGFFIHANLRWRFGWLERVVSTPTFHHWHHADDGPEVLNKNFAPMMPWVDQIFGTLYLPGRKWPMKYGTDTPVAPTVVGQLLDPLGPRG